MLERFNPSALLRGHWRGLSIDGPDGTSTLARDVTAQAVFALIPAGLAVVAYVLHWKLAAATPLLSGVALLAGGLLAAFGQLTSFRQRLFESMAFEGDGESLDRNMVDETVAHLLLAAFLCGVDGILLVVGLNITKVPGEVDGVLAALTIGVSAYVALLFMLAVPRLYIAYATYNKVSRHISGTRQ